MNKLNIKKHYAAIFTSIAVTGIFLTTAWAIYTGIETERRLSKLNTPEDPKEKIKLYVKTLWKYYVVVSLGVLASSTAAIMSHKISAKDIARLATLATGSGAAFKKYRGKIKEILGEEKEKEIFEQVKAEKEWHMWPANVDQDCPEYKLMDTKFRLKLGVDEIDGVEFYSNQLRVANALWCFERDYMLGRMADVALLKDFLGIKPENIDHKYFWIDSMFLEAGYESTWIDLEPIKHQIGRDENGEPIYELDEHGKPVFEIVATNASPITDEELRAIEDGSYWDEWRYKCDKED